MILSTIFSALFFDVDAPRSYALNRAASAVSNQLKMVERIMYISCSVKSPRGLSSVFRGTPKIVEAKWRSSPSSSRPSTKISLSA
jgi:hypothetical protein